MGRFLGKHIPDEFNKDYAKANIPEWEKWYHAGYEDGMDFGKYETEETLYEDLQQQLASYKAREEANIRVNEVIALLRKENSELQEKLNNIGKEIHE